MSLQRLFPWFRRLRMRREIDDEIDFHLNMRRSEYRKSGMSNRDATVAARSRFGDVKDVRDAVHRVRHIPIMNQAGAMNGMWQDLRFGFRGFVRQPTFTGLAVLTLALGIGANTAIFGLVNSVILNPWPFEDSDRMAWLWSQRAGNMMIPPTKKQLDLWSEAEQLEGMASLTWTEVAVGTEEGAVAVGAGYAAPELFGFLDVLPIIGRAFVVEDSVVGTPNVVMIGEAFWKTRFGARSGVLGETLEINGVSHEVIGVAPGTLDRLFQRSQSDVWLPLRNSNDGAGLSTVVRIRRSASFESATAELVGIDARLDEDAREADWQPHLVPPHRMTSSQLRTGLWVLLGAVGLVLLISCANVANMVLARGVGRQHEMAIRTALGAGRARLARQLITESLMLTLFGAATGITLAYFGLDLLQTFAPSGLTELKYASLSPRVLVAGSVAGITSGVVFGLLPAARGVGVWLAVALRQGTRVGDSKSHTRFRQILVGFEVALAFVLFVSAGLLVRSFIQLNAVDPGFAVDQLVSVRINLPETRYPNATSRSAFFEEVRARVRQLPAVSEATVAMGVPPRMGAMLGAVEIEGRIGAFDAKAGVISSNWVFPEYFATLGIRVISGRVFHRDDDPSLSAVVNQQFAREMWPNETATGKRFRWEGQDEWTTVVGVVGDVKAFGLADEPERVQIYRMFEPEDFFSGGVVLARATGDPQDVLGLIRGQVAAVDAAVPVRDATTVAAMFSDSIARQRFNTLSLAAFALLALVLAITGVYGVITLTVNQRMREIGVRLALGANVADVKFLMLRWGMRPVVIGMIVGLGVSLLVGRVLTSLLYDIVATDLLTYAVALAMMTLVGIAAVYVPARRAAQIDPIDAVRGQ